MSRFAAGATPLPGLLTIDCQRVRDSRGFLSRLFCAEEMHALGWNGPVAQVNHTFTSLRATVRGMHFQLPPYSEQKLVGCIRGEVFDVAVDLRRGSPTFLCWHAERLSGDNLRSLLIPAGFAHGYQTLTADCELIYLHSVAHHPPAEAGVSALDPRLGIEWPLEIGEMSGRDRSHRLLNADFAGIEL